MLFLFFLTGFILGIYAQDRSPVDIASTLEVLSAKAWEKIKELAKKIKDKFKEASK